MSRNLFTLEIPLDPPEIGPSGTRASADSLQVICLCGHPRLSYARFPGKVCTRVDIGLVKFATLAVRIGQAALPAYPRKFSKRQFTQPQLLAVLCLMRYDEGTSREAEVHLVEHQELRAALGLPVIPDDTTLYRHQHIRRTLRAQSVIPAWRGGAKWHIQDIRVQMRQAFPAHLYRRLSSIESVISAVKRKLSARAPNCSLGTPYL